MINIESGTKPTIRRTHVGLSLRRWSFGGCILLLLGVMAGCDAVEPDANLQLETDYEDDGILYEGPDPDEIVPMRSDLAEAAGVLDRAHWADGYVWADKPVAPSYPADPFYSYNRTGGGITITKPAGTVGRYLVRFVGLSDFLGARSTVQVTAYLGNDAFCKAAGSRLVNDVVEVRCFDVSSRAAVDAYFTVLVTRNYTDHAFAHVNRPTETNYAPPANASWNPAGTIRIHRLGIGQYQVRSTALEVACREMAVTCRSAPSEREGSTARFQAGGALRMSP